MSDSASSVYQIIGSINMEHGIFVVQHCTTKKIYVQKVLEVYNHSVYAHLQKCPIPNTPRIYDLYEEQGHLVLIEEYISGYTLEELLNAQGRFSEQVVVNYMIPLCRIVSRLHGYNPPIIHRDIKPSNIVITPSKQVILLDFNAAKFWSPNQAQDTVLLGTHGYAAPEQYGFGSSGPQTDIYSMGILMNTLLTGSLESPHISSGKLAGIIEKCTNLNPKERYSCVDDLQHALQQVLQATSQTQPVPTPETAMQENSRPYAAASLQSSAKKRRNPTRSYALPGFRSKKLLNMMLAITGYLFIITLGMSLKVTDSSGDALSGIELFLNRIFCTAMLLAMVLCSCNYLDIQSHFFLTRSKKPVLRILGILLLDGVILFVFMTLLVLITALFFPS